MKKIKYKDQNNKNYIAKIVALLVLIFIFFLIELVLDSSMKNKQNASLYSFATIKQVIEYYDSKYITEKDRNTPNFRLDAFVEFKKPLYTENDESNEEYFMNIINACARVTYFQSYKLIDEKNDITIEVICDGEKIVSIIINGMEDYFIYMDSQINLKQYVEIPITEVTVNSPILQQCIDNKWQDGIIDFGSRDSIFNGYEIYFDEGIKVREISGKIFNIVIDNRYNQNVINDIFPGMDFDTIENILGNPAFEDVDNNIIGYKTKNFYIFFHDNEISIYRNADEETEKFYEILDKFINEELKLTEFMNELTYIWPDYSDYEYDSDFVYISYPLKGIEIKINYDDINGILVYNNIKGSLPKISRYLQNTYFVARLQLDLVFTHEIKRVEEEEKMIDNCLEFKESLDEEKLEIIGESLKYDIYPLKDRNGYIFSVRFISKNGDMPNRELNDGVNTFAWFGDYFIYSKKLKGIFSYDINTGIVRRLITGQDNFNIVDLKDGVLKYDDKEVMLQY